MNFEEWFADCLADARTSNLTTPPWLLDVQSAKAVYASMAPSPAKQAAVDETAQLRAEVAQLRRQVAAVEASRLKDVRASNRNFAALHDALLGAPGDSGKRGVLDEMIDLIKQLEQRELDAVPLPSGADIAQAGRHGPQLYFAGDWDAARKFRPGDVVRRLGYTWVAQIENRGCEPDESPAQWQVLHRSMTYRDVYKSGATYRVGDTVRHGGSLWLAMQDTGEKPGASCPDWRLIVRAGRDGRPAKPMEPACR